MKEMEEEADRKEREQLRAAIEEHKRLEMENQERIKQRNLGLQRDLEMQMDYQGRLKYKQREGGEGGVPVRNGESIHLCSEGGEYLGHTCSIRKAERHSVCYLRA